MFWYWLLSDTFPFISNTRVRNTIYFKKILVDSVSVIDFLSYSTYESIKVN